MARGGVAAVQCNVRMRVWGSPAHLVCALSMPQSEAGLGLGWALQWRQSLLLCACILGLSGNLFCPPWPWAAPPPLSLALDLPCLACSSALCRQLPWLLPCTAHSAQTLLPCLPCAPLAVEGLLQGCRGASIWQRRPSTRVPRCPHCWLGRMLWGGGSAAVRVEVG
jgi:hypothetical protein